MNVYCPFGATSDDKSKISPLTWNFVPETYLYIHCRSRPGLAAGIGYFPVPVKIGILWKVISIRWTLLIDPANSVNHRGDGERGYRGCRGPGVGCCGDHRRKAGHWRVGRCRQRRGLGRLNGWRRRCRRNYFRYLDDRSRLGQLGNDRQRRFVFTAS